MRNLTLYCCGMRSIELGIFIPPSMSRIIQSTIINIFYDQPRVCGNMILKILKNFFFVSPQSEKIQQLQVEILKFGQLVRKHWNLFSFRFGLKNSTKNIKFYMLRIHICGNLNFQIWSSYGVHMN